MHSAFYDRLNRRTVPTHRPMPKPSQQPKNVRTKRSSARQAGQSAPREEIQLASSQPIPPDQDGLASKTNEPENTDVKRDGEDGREDIEESIAASKQVKASPGPHSRKTSTPSGNDGRPLVRDHSIRPSSSRCLDTSIRSDREKRLEEELAMQKKMMEEMREVVREMAKKRGSTSQTPVVEENPSINKKSRVPETRTLKRHWELMMEKRLPQLDTAFSRPVISRCIFNSLCSLVLDDPVEQNSEEEGIADVLDTIFFAIQPNEKKNQWQSDDGKRASMFRTRTMICVVMNLRMDTFKIFKPNDDDEDERPEKPFWLSGGQGKQPAFISRSDVIAAVKSMEQCGRGFGNYSKRVRLASDGKFDRSDDALFAMRSLYSCITKHLNESRKAGPAEFFDFIGYLFVSWKSFRNCPVKDSTLELSWAADEDGNEVQLNDIPDCHMHTKGEADRVTKNEELYKNFTASRPELVLTVEHDVMVRLGGRSSRLRRHTGEAVKRWRRGVHLMDVAAFFVKAFCLFDKHESIYEMLSYHRRSIAVLYSMAIVLRMVLESRKRTVVSEATQSEDIQASTSKTEHQGRSKYTDEEKQVLDDIFNILMPCEGTISRNANHVLCCVPEETFRAEHIGNDEQHADEHEEILGEDLERSLDMYHFDM